MKVREALIAIILGAVLVLMAGGQTNVTTPDVPKPNQSCPTYKVVRVVDGDTVDLLIDGKNTRVRLIGVDTPETVDPRKPVEEYGKEASRFTTNLLLGEDVWVEQEPDNTVDKYGRSLYYLYRAPDGLFVNLEIVRQGYGHAYTIYPFKYMELFRYYEKKASDNGKGLWAASTGANDTIKNAATADIKDGSNQPRMTLSFISLRRVRSITEMDANTYLVARYRLRRARLSNEAILRAVCAIRKVNNGNGNDSREKEIKFCTSPRKGIFQ
jgi:micrococcal nuclease